MQEQIAAQVAEQWKALLALMTAQGASRADIIELSAATARAIIELTAENLWPPLTAENLWPPRPNSLTAPLPEMDAQDRFTAVLDVLEGVKG